jgi:hypothetical protein
MEGNVGIANTRAAFQTYSNFNSLNAVAKVGNLSFLVPSNPSLSIGYQASTIGMEMQCRFVNQDCKLWVFNSKNYPLDENAYEAGYDCSQAFPSFKGYLSGTNATLLSRFNDTLRFQSGSPENPFQLGIGTLNTANVTFDSDLDLNVSGNANANPPLGGAGRTYTKYNNLFAMLLCEGAVYNLTYGFRNETYTILSKSLADTNINWLVTAPMVMGSALPFPVKAVAAAMDLATSAATAKANSIGELETFFGDGISQVGIAFATGVFNSTASLQVSHFVYNINVGIFTPYNHCLQNSCFCLLVFRFVDFGVWKRWCGIRDFGVVDAYNSVQIWKTNPNCGCSRLYHGYLQTLEECLRRRRQLSRQCDRTWRRVTVMLGSFTPRGRNGPNFPSDTPVKAHCSETRRRMYGAGLSLSGTVGF